MDELGLQALIDLHSGPGSQNGYDNSGRYNTKYIDKSYDIYGLKSKSCIKQPKLVLTSIMLSPV